MRTFAITLVTLGLLGGPLAISSSAGKPGSEEAAQAKEHYEKGQKLYELGKYPEAVKEFEAAYELKDNPVLLYNIAQAHRLDNRYPDALRFYRTYLKKFQAVNHKEAPNKAEVDTKIADMETLIAQQNRVATGVPTEAIPPGGKPPGTARTGTTSSGGGATTAETGGTSGGGADNGSGSGSTTTTGGNGSEGTQVASAERTESGSTEGTERTGKPAGAEKLETPTETERAPAAPKPGRTKLIAGIAIAVVGVAAAGAGVGMGVLAMGQSSQAEQNAKTGVPFDPNVESSGKMYQNVGLALDAVGGALVVTGVVLAVLGARENSKAAERPVTIAPSVRPGYAGASLQYSF